jgi:hypothetical protein
VRPLTLLLALLLLQCGANAQTEKTKGSCPRATSRPSFPPQYPPKASAPAMTPHRSQILNSILGSPHSSCSAGLP